MQDHFDGDPHHTGHIGYRAQDNWSQAIQPFAWSRGTLVQATIRMRNSTTITGCHAASGVASAIEDASPRTSVALVACRNGGVRLLERSVHTDRRHQRIAGAVWFFYASPPPIWRLSLVCPLGLKAAIVHAARANVCCKVCDGGGLCCGRA